MFEIRSSINAPQTLTSITPLSTSSSNAVTSPMLPQKLTSIPPTSTSTSSTATSPVSPQRLKSISSHSAITSNTATSPMSPQRLTSTPPLSTSTSNTTMSVSFASQTLNPNEQGRPCTLAISEKGTKLAPSSIFLSRSSTSVVPASAADETLSVPVMQWLKSGELGKTETWPTGEEEEKEEDDDCRLQDGSASVRINRMAGHEEEDIGEMEMEIEGEHECLDSESPSNLTTLGTSKWATSTCEKETSTCRNEASTCEKETSMCRNETSPRGNETSTCAKEISIHGTESSTCGKETRIHEKKSTGKKTNTCEKEISTCKKETSACANESSMCEKGEVIYLCSPSTHERTVFTQTRAQFSPGDREPVAPSSLPECERVCVSTDLEQSPEPLSLVDDSNSSTDDGVHNASPSLKVISNTDSEKSVDPSSLVTVSPIATTPATTPDHITTTTSLIGTTFDQSTTTTSLVGTTVAITPDHITTTTATDKGRTISTATGTTSGYLQPEGTTPKTDQRTIVSMAASAQGSSVQSVGTTTPVMTTDEDTTISTVTSTPSGSLPQRAGFSLMPSFNLFVSSANWHSQPLGQVFGMSALPVRLLPLDNGGCGGREERKDVGGSPCKTQLKTKRVSE